MHAVQTFQLEIISLKINMASYQLFLCLGVIMSSFLLPILCDDETKFTRIDPGTEIKEEVLKDDAGIGQDVAKELEQPDQYTMEDDKKATAKEPDADMTEDKRKDFGLGHTLEGNRDRSRSRSRGYNQRVKTIVQPVAAKQRPKAPVQVGITPRMARMLVAMHNNYRRNVPGPAANMEEMTWDDDLESMAADYAKECIWGHGNPDNITPYQHVGQNLAYSRGGAPASPMYLISHWFNEKENYDINTDSCVPGTVCGHYTQIVWAHTKKMGCAMHLCPVLRDPLIEGASFKNAQLLVCNYGPGGNVNGHAPYQIGQQCSLCASGLGNCKNGLCSGCSLLDQGCECRLDCQNGGSINPDACKCDCPAGWTGTLCQNVCNNTHPWCGDGWPKQWCFLENDANPVEQLCPALCGVCECGGPDCVNGGVKNPDSCMCDCPKPWTGASCSECNIQCIHGTMDHANCQCTCNDGWMGESCAERCENTNKVLCHRGWYPNWCDAEHPYVLKYCQAMCGVCNPVMAAEPTGDCDVTCYNNGVVNQQTCQCECLDGWHGEDCTVQCEDQFQYCEWSDAIMCENNEDFALNFCPVSCGKCNPNLLGGSSRLV
ncbi:multiple epidermal growth factor-like domains protein 6 [Asterias rubens]|uniref:multiple epidermal growth factor-like domains protein 6 n=1 Tax=Asterias rubens TaxID=7604 RepID=UPI0014556384|nr:multiple epidermal growth factor-like domains protein 6 [Asterias rubens]